MSLPIFNQLYAIDFHPTDFWGFKTVLASQLDYESSKNEYNKKEGEYHRHVTNSENIAITVTDSQMIVKPIYPNKHENIGKPQASVNRY